LRNTLMRPDSDNPNNAQIVQFHRDHVRSSGRSRGDD
jgi:hypothetical protein